MDTQEGTIECIGIDGKRHVCFPYEDKTLCGVTVSSKKIRINDYERYSCYECTY